MIQDFYGEKYYFQKEKEERTPIYALWGVLLHKIGHKIMEGGGLFYRWYISNTVHIIEITSGTERTWTFSHWCGFSGYK